MRTLNNNFIFSIPNIQNVRRAGGCLTGSAELKPIEEKSEVFRFLSVRMLRSHEPVRIRTIRPEPEKPQFVQERCRFATTTGNRKGDEIGISRVMFNPIISIIREPTNVTFWDCLLWLN